jgi:HEAT repeat protein
MSFLRDLFGKKQPATSSGSQSPRNVEVYLDGTMISVDANDENILKRLLAKLETNDDPIARMGAAESLGELRNQKALVPLIDALRGRTEYDRLGAAKALGQLGNPKAIEPLVVALRDKSSSGVRKAAAIALGMIGDEKVIRHLQQAIEQEDSYTGVIQDSHNAVKRAAQNAIEEIKAKK